MKNLNSYKKIAKELIKEAAWDRKFGEPLPTLEDVMKEASDDDKVIGKNDQNRDVTIRHALDSTSDNSTMKFLKKKAQRFKDTGDSGDKPKGKKDSGGKLSGGDFKREGIEESTKPKIHPFKKTYKKIGGK